MTMRPAALAAVPALALLGCGVPDTPIPVVVKEKPAATSVPNKPAELPKVKAAETDPAKLGEKIVDTKVGTGTTAEDGDTLQMRYTGRLKSDGSVFDSTAAHGDKPFTFPLGGGQVIKGWDIGIKGMKVGGKRTLEIPPELAYGPQAQDKIPANSTLVFDVDLVDVQKAADAQTVERTTLAPGTGPAVKLGDMVSITYKASLADGTVVDDQTAKPIQFKVGAPEVAVKGLNLALVGMKKGQRVEATIPPLLGYAGGMMSEKVPPGSTLKFLITLVSVG